MHHSLLRVWGWRVGGGPQGMQRGQEPLPEERAYLCTGQHYSDQGWPPYSQLSFWPCCFPSLKSGYLSCWLWNQNKTPAVQSSELNNPHPQLHLPISPSLPEDLAQAAGVPSLGACIFLLCSAHHITKTQFWNVYHKYYTKGLLSNASLFDAYTCVHTYTFTHKYTCMGTCAHTRTYAWTHICWHTCTCTWIHKHMLPCMDTHRHTHILTALRSTLLEEGLLPPSQPPCSSVFFCHACVEWTLNDWSCFGNWGCSDW